MKSSIEKDKKYCSWGNATEDKEKPGFFKVNAYCTCGRFLIVHISEERLKSIQSGKLRKPELICEKCLSQEANEIHTKCGGGGYTRR